MKWGIRAAHALAVALALGSTGLWAQDEAEGGRGEKVDGYAEFRLGDCLVADAQRVCPAPGLKFKGEGEAKSFAAIPLGYELKAKGRRRADGTLLAREVEAKPNGSAMFEGEIKSATDQAEAEAREKGRFTEGDRGEAPRLARAPELETGRRADPLGVRDQAVAEPELGVAVHLLATAAFRLVLGAEAGRAQCESDRRRVCRPDPPLHRALPLRRDEPSPAGFPAKEHNSAGS